MGRKVYHIFPSRNLPGVESDCLFKKERNDDTKSKFQLEVDPDLKWMEIDDE